MDEREWDRGRTMNDQWSVERLVEYAQNMDRAYQEFGNDGVLDKRKLAFGARKYARAKQRLDTGGE